MFKQKDIKKLIADKIIESENDSTLEKIKKIWFSDYYLKRMLVYRSKYKRKKLIQSCELSKPESFVLTQIEKTDNVRKIYKNLLIQLKQFYRIEGEQAKQIISKMARKVRMRRYYEHKKKER